MAKNTAKRGRPVEHILTPNQEKSIKAQIKKGVTSTEIYNGFHGKVHEFAILRLRRQLRKGK